MAPWPEAESSSPFTMSPSNSPNQDPFAAYGAANNTGAVPQCNTQQQQQQQQPADPWAAMTAAPPAQAPPAPTMAPPQVPMQMQAQPTQPQAQQLTPPPNTVFANNNNQAPPSPLGDVSVLAAAANANANAAPAVPNAMQYGMQPLQPAPAAHQAPVAVAASNPFDMPPVAQSMPPLAAPPAGMPPQAPPTPPWMEQQQLQNNTLSPTTSPVPANAFAPHQQFADPFGYTFSPMTSPVTSPNTSPGNNNNGAVVPSAMPNADPFGVGAPAMPAVIQQQQQQQAVVPSAGAFSKLAHPCHSIC